MATDFQKMKQAVDGQRDRKSRGEGRKTQLEDERSRIHALIKEKTNRVVSSVTDVGQMQQEALQKATTGTELLRKTLNDNNVQW